MSDDINAEEEPEPEPEPENFNYPQDPRFRAMVGPRGVLRCKGTDRDDPTVDPRCGKIGRQTIEDTGPLNRKRMETIDDETSSAAVEYVQRQVKAGKPFFVWYNSTRMHFRTHVRTEHRIPKGVFAPTEYADGMVEHDASAGSLLKALDGLGIAENTIVIYTPEEPAEHGRRALGRLPANRRSRVLFVPGCAGTAGRERIDG